MTVDPSNTAAMSIIQVAAQEQTKKVVEIKATRMLDNLSAYATRDALAADVAKLQEKKIAQRVFQKPQYTKSVFSFTYALRERKLIWHTKRISNSTLTVAKRVRARESSWITTPSLPHLTPPSIIFYPLFLLAERVRLSRRSCVVCGS